MKKTSFFKSFAVLLITAITFTSCGKTSVVGTWNLESEDETESYTFKKDGTVESIDDDTKYLGTYKYENEVLTISFTKSGTILASGAVDEYDSLDREFIEYGIVDGDEIYIGDNKIKMPGENSVEGTFSWSGKRYTMYGAFDVTYTLTLTPYSEDDNKVDGFLGKSHYEEVINARAFGSFTNEYTGDYTRRTVNHRDVLSTLLVNEDKQMIMLGGTIKNGFWYPFNSTLKKQK